MNANDSKKGLRQFFFNHSHCINNVYETGAHSYNTIRSGANAAVVDV